jgi:hypothetical protein
VEKGAPLGLPIISALLTQDELNIWGEEMKATSDKKDLGDKPTILPPGPYKKDTKRKSWEEQFSNYLGTKYGQAKAPLSCVIHPNDAPGNLGDYNDDHDNMIYLTTHTRVASTKDNL